MRVLRSFVNLYDDLIMFLKTVLDLESPLLHVFDRSSDQYLCQKIKDQPHEPAIVGLSAYWGTKAWMVWRLGLGQRNASRRFVTSGASQFRAFIAWSQAI